MSFNKRKLTKVRDLAQRVANAADALIFALDTETRHRYVDGQFIEESVHTGRNAPMDAGFITGTRATGEFRRLTMDLTRALADARKAD